MDLFILLLMHRACAFTPPLFSNVVAVSGLCKVLLLHREPLLWFSPVVHWLLFLTIVGWVPLCFGCCRLLWDRFGHDRAKNDQGSCFSPVKYLIARLLHTRSGFVLELHWIRE